MAQQPDAKTSESPVKRITRLLVMVVIGLALICIASYYQEDIHLFLRLRAWDRQAPGRVVTAFLNAAKQGDAAEADRYMGSSEYQPLKVGDKTAGYFVATPAGTMDFYFENLVPPGGIKVSSINFVFIAEGAAEVEVPHEGGEVAKYRLKMINGEWKITDILGGGRQRKSDGAPPGAGPPG